MDVAAYENAIRDRLHNAPAALLSAAAIRKALNAGYRITAALALCCETTREAITQPGIDTVHVPWVRINHVILNERQEQAYVFTDGDYVFAAGDYEWAAAVVELASRGLLRISPAAAANVPIEGDQPQYYFTWGALMVIVPGSELGGYSLTLHGSDMPAEELADDTDQPTGLPPEFADCPLDYALAVCAMALKRWKTARDAYNRFLSNLAERRIAYQDRMADTKAAREIPAGVRYAVH